MQNGVTLETLRPAMEAMHAQAEAFCEREFVDEGDLDESVIDHLSRLASRAANEGGDFNSAQDAAEHLASQINNEGQEAQVACLYAMGLDDDQIIEEGCL